MTFSERIDAVVKLLNVPGRTISVYFDKRTDSAAYNDVVPVVGTFMIDHEGNASIRHGMDFVHTALGVELESHTIQWLNGRTVAAWLVAGTIRTIGSLGYPGKPEPMTPWMLERFIARNPKAAARLGRYRPLTADDLST